MRLTEAELSELYRAETARSARQVKDCPSAGAMTRAAAGELSEDEHARWVDHLVTCSDCAAEFQLLRALDSWDAASATAPAMWNELASTEIQARSDAARKGWWPRFSAQMRLPAFGYAMGAALLVSGLLVGWWVFSLRRENQRLAAQVNEQRIAMEKLAAKSDVIDTTDPNLSSGLREVQIANLPTTGTQLSKPELNVRIIDLEPGAANRGESGGALKRVILSKGASFFTCVLNVTGQPSFTNYSLKITNQRGQTMWQGAGLRKSPDNTFTLALPSRLLPAGRYQLKLYGTKPPQHEPVAVYAVQVQYK